MKTKLIMAGVSALLMPTAINAQNWALTGNAGTVDGTNFIGTTDNIPFNIRVNNIPAGKIDHIAQNTFFGHYAGNINAITGIRNSAFGSYALNTNTTGQDNCAFGYALPYNTTGSGNVGIGTGALQDNITGNNSVGVGAYALSNANGGENNVAVGHSALYLNGTGTENTAIGFLSGVTTINLYNTTSLGSLAVANANDKVRIGDANVSVIEGQPAFYTSSDGRFKTNLSEDDVKGLDFIKRLRPVVYNFDTKKFEDFLCKNMPDSIRRKHLSRDFSKSTAIRRTGFIAQEVEKAAKEATFNFDGVHAPVDENDNYSLAYGEFVVPLVKAMQEQQAMIEKMELKMQEQDKLISELRKQNTSTGINNNTSNNFFMGQNEPNPFTHETVIHYALPANTNNAYLAVYDLSGKQITSFGIEKTSTSTTITSEKLSAGIYLYSIVCNGKIFDSKRMIVAEK